MKRTYIWDSTLYRLAGACFGLALCLSPRARAQQSTPVLPAPPAAAPAANPSPVPSTDKPAAPLPASGAAEQQAQILADTRRLFQLAAELKVEVVNSSPDTLSLGVVKKAAEVEKLARSLNLRMKN